MNEMNCPYFINLIKLGRLSSHTTDKNEIKNSYSLPTCVKTTGLRVLGHKKHKFNREEKKFQVSFKPV